MDLRSTMTGRQLVSSTKVYAINLIERQRISPVSLIVGSFALL